jgi:outer membrane receptor protein involved in Fe transport
VTPQKMRTWEIGGFIQDDWRATDWLTLNLGVRYDIFTPFTEVSSSYANLDLETAEGWCWAPTTRTWA